MVEVVRGLGFVYGLWILSLSFLKVFWLSGSGFRWVWGSGFSVYPKGPCTQRGYTLAPKYLYRDYSKAKVCTIWVHGPLGLGFRVWSLRLLWLREALRRDLVQKLGFGVPYFNTFFLKGTIMD